MPKKGENIYKRRDNRWEGRYYVYQPDGAKKQRSVYGKSYGEVKLKLGVCREQAQKNIAALPCSRMTVKNLFQLWLAGKADSVKLSSYHHYKNIVNTHLLPGLGSISLNKLTAKELSAFILQKNKSLAVKTVTDILAVVKAAVRMAAKEYFLPQAAAILELKAPPGKPQRIEPFSEQEINGLSAQLLANKNRRNIAVLLALNCGLRLGEVCALQWSDIDFAAQTLAVNKSVQRLTIEGKSQLFVQSPKSANSRRVIPLTAEMLSLLQGLEKKEDFVFGVGKPLEPRTLQYHFTALQKKCGIRRRNFHILRHTFASRYIEAGADVKSLSEILGHAKVSLTMQLYVHPSMAQKRFNMEAVNFIKHILA